ncbi:hypothetical protein SKAU_G00379770 [Synaphobranchus kaupii]|uniref:Uncharacterized protein n=1 Tax=Synaphobranchus kaupii TaxID=118154 RepID=A0A9Q1EDE9_SYNKA|nr:hypothetical protein SKAU_G00379770 [Synaphobranchus kaupii]
MADASDFAVKRSVFARSLSGELCASLMLKRRGDPSLKERRTPPHTSLDPLRVAEGPQPLLSSKRLQRRLNDPKPGEIRGVLKLLGIAPGVCGTMKPPTPKGGKVLKYDQALSHDPRLKKRCPEAWYQMFPDSRIWRRRVPEAL